MTESLARLSLRDFADRLASKNPSPGGGAVAAVTAAHAAALGCMALAYTLGKPRFAQFETDNAKALESLRHSQSEALALADQDAATYAACSELMRLPPTDARRVAEGPAAMKAATDAPMSILKLALVILNSLGKLPRSCNPSLLSDLAIAVALADTSAVAAGWNVRVNAPQLATPLEREAAQQELARLLGLVRDARQSIDAEINDLMKAK